MCPSDAIVSTDPQRSYKQIDSTADVITWDFAGGAKTLTATDNFWADDLWGDNELAVGSPKNRVTVTVTVADSGLLVGDSIDGVARATYRQADYPYPTFAVEKSVSHVAYSCTPCG